MATTKKAAETAEKTEVSAAETTADTVTTVTIEKLALVVKSSFVNLILTIVFPVNFFSITSVSVS